MRIRLPKDRKWHRKEYYQAFKVSLFVGIGLIAIMIILEYIATPDSILSGIGLLCLAYGIIAIAVSITLLLVDKHEQKIAK